MHGFSSVSRCTSSSFQEEVLSPPQSWVACLRPTFSTKVKADLLLPGGSSLRPSHCLFLWRFSVFQIHVMPSSVSTSPFRTRSKSGSGKRGEIRRGFSFRVQRMRGPRSTSPSQPSQVVSPGTGRSRGGFPILFGF